MKSSIKLEIRIEDPLGMVFVRVSQEGTIRTIEEVHLIYWMWCRRSRKVYYIKGYERE